MSQPHRHIHPTFDQLLGRAEKEDLLNQNAKVLWFTGLSGSGKTTLAAALESELHDRGFLTQVLDGDNVRSGINSNLGFSEEDRAENIRRIAEVARLFLDCGVITLCCFISPTRAMREQARAIIGPADFVEVFVNTPLEECERRDVKGLYAKARAGQIKGFTGIDAPFEAPEAPQVEIRTQGQALPDSTRQLLQRVLPLVDRPVTLD